MSAVYLVGQFEIRLKQRVPVLLPGLIPSTVLRDCRVIDDNMNRAKGLDGILDDVAAILWGTIVWDSSPARCGYLVDDLIDEWL